MDNKKLLDKVAEVPAMYIAAGVAVFVILIGAGFWYWAYDPKTKQIASLEQDLQKLQLELQKAEAYAARYDEFKEELRQVELKLKEALKKLPEQKEIANLLDQINESALDAGLTISTFTPSGEEPKEFYSDVPVQIQVTGGYHNFATFADVISKMERIVTLRAIRMNPIMPEGVSLNIACTAITFRQAQEQPKQ